MARVVVEDVPEELYGEFEALCNSRESSVADEVLKLMRREMEKARKAEVMAHIKRHVEGGES